MEVLPYTIIIVYAKRVFRLSDGIFGCFQVQRLYFLNELNYFSQKNVVTWCR